jgi:hypothetical protein
MPLPKALQAQADAADATLKAMYPDSHGDSQGVAEPVPPIPVPVVQASEPQPPAQPQAQPVVTQQPQPPQDDSWEQRYRTLQGIHNKQVGELKDRLDQLSAQHQQLLDRLNAPPPAAQPQPVAPNSQDVEVFGEDLVRMIQRTAEQMLGPVATSVEQRLSQLEQNLQGTNRVVAKTADDTFFTDLRTQVPNFDQINTSEPFLAWLAEEDDLTGLPRQSALTAAGNARDLNRVVKVFKAFFKATGHSAESSAPATPASRLQAQVSPVSSGNGSASVTTNAQGKPLITTQQVERFYSDVRRGAYRGNDQMRMATEAVINEALAEGRILQPGAHRPAL